MSQQKCRICKSRTRKDGFCSKCMQMTGPRSISSGDVISYYNADGMDNKAGQLGKQLQWLEHKVEAAKSPEAKKKAEDKLNVWWDTHDGFIVNYKSRLKSREEVEKWLNE